MEDETSLDVLIDRAKTGDRKAFDSVVKKHSARLGALVRSILGGKLAAKVDVEDLVQETFLQAWQSVRQFRGRGEDSFWAWLGTVATHVVGMQGRKAHAKKRDPGAEVSLNQPVRTSGGGPGELADLLKKSAVSPSSAFRRDERFDRLRHALGRLSPEHREVVYLARIRELRIDEVAKRMGRSPEAISMLLYRALLKLKEAFGTTESCSLGERSLKEEDHGT